MTIDIPSLNQFRVDDLATWNRDVAHLLGVAYGVIPEDRLLGERKPA